MSSRPKKASNSKTSGKTTKATAKAASTSKKASPGKAPLRAPAGKVPSAPVAKPTVVNKPTPVLRGPMMRKKELVDTVVTRTGLKKKDAKPVVESVLEVLGEAMAHGRELVLPPMGKLVVRKEKKLPKGKMMVVRVRQRTPPDQV